MYRYGVRLGLMVERIRLNKNRIKIKESLIKIRVNDGGAIKRIHLQSPIKVVWYWWIKNKKNNIGNENINAKLAYGSVPLSKENLRVVLESKEKKTTNSSKIIVNPIWLSYNF